MGFLILRHIDGDQVALAAVEDIGQRQRRLGLTYATRADEQEHPDRPARVFQPGAGSADALADGFQRMRLANDALFQEILERQHGAGSRP